MFLHHLADPRHVHKTFLHTASKKIRRLGTVCYIPIVSYIFDSAQVLSADRSILVVYVGVFNFDFLCVQCLDLDLYTVMNDRNVNLSLHKYVHLLCL